MFDLDECGGNASKELASVIREGIQAFCRCFETSQFDEMAQFYSPDTTLMLSHRPTIRGANSLPAVFSELKDAGLRNWRIEPNRVEQFCDTALEYGTYSFLMRQPNGIDVADRGKYLVVWRRQTDSR